MLEPASFAIRTRHIFGFLVPGTLWLVLLLPLLRRETVLAFLESGQLLVRATIFLGAAYLVGYSIQTLTFYILVRPYAKSRDDLPHAKVFEQIEQLLTKRMSALGLEWALPKASLPVFCKFFVLEKSRTLKDLLLEKEDDINFIVASICPAPVVGWYLVWARWRSWWISAAAAIVAVAIAVFLYRRLQRYRTRELEEWAESALVLAITDSLRSEKARQE